MEDLYYWYLCPRCNKRIFKIYNDTEIINLKVKCKLCKNVILVNIKRGENYGNNGKSEMQEAYKVVQRSN